MSTDTKDLSSLHELMCSDALEGGLSLDESVQCQRLAERYPQVNTQFYWEALAAADLVLDGAGIDPPPEVREGWIALSESVGMATAGEDRLDATVAVWDDQAVDVERYADERSLTAPAEPEGRLWPWIAVLILAIGAAGFWLYPDVSRALERNATLQQWLGTVQPQGDEQPVLISLTGDAAGTMVWDASLQRGRLEVNTRGMTLPLGRQAQVWLVDSDRDQSFVPVALLDQSRALHSVDISVPVRIQQYAGVVITSEVVGGSLSPSKSHILASSVLPEDI